MTTITATDRMAEVRRRLPGARQAMIAALGTIPAAGGSGGSSGPSDRTGRLACAYLANPDIDPARRDLDTLTMILYRARARRHFTNGEIAAMLDLCDRWAPTPRRKAKLDDNLRAAAGDLLNATDDHHNCRSCKRVPGAWGEPHKNGLCKNCDRWLQRTLLHYDVTIDMPPLALVAIGLERYKITDADIHTVMHGKPRRD